MSDANSHLLLCFVVILTSFILFLDYAQQPRVYLNAPENDDNPRRGELLPFVHLVAVYDRRIIRCVRNRSFLVICNQF